MVLVAVKEKRVSYIQGKEYGAWSGEAVAFCPKCKALQTVWISHDKLMPTRKFFQEGRAIYHDCGSDMPCHLYIRL